MCVRFSNTTTIGCDSGLFFSNSRVAINWSIDTTDTDNNRLSLIGSCKGVCVTSILLCAREIIILLPKIEVLVSTLSPAVKRIVSHLWRRELRSHPSENN